MITTNVSISILCHWFVRVKVYRLLPSFLKFCSQSDRSFSFTTTSPPTSYFLKTAAGVEKGASRPGHEVVGEVTLKHIYEIAQIKSKDPAFEGISLESVCKTIIGSARSLGINVVR